MARPGDPRLFVLNPLAAWLWEAREAGYDADAMAGLLAERFALAADEAKAQVGALLEHWRREALTGPRAGIAQPPPALPRPGVGTDLKPRDTASPVRSFRIGGKALGLAMDGRHGVVLIGQGGAGKTTLATALNAAGHPLLSDDVVPVNADGQLVGLGLSVCLKPGSWPVLAPLRPDLETIPPLLRFGEWVRYLPPAGPAPEAPVPLRLFLFPTYLPNAEPALTPLAPEGVLQGIVTAEAVIRNLTQDKLDALARWVASAPAFELVYPDLDSGVALVRQCFDATVRAEPSRF